jgi:hypothetical protein
MRIVDPEQPVGTGLGVVTNSAEAPPKRSKYAWARLRGGQADLYLEVHRVLDSTAG